MTHDDIIRMAQTCGFSREDHHAIYGMLAKFGDMVAAAEKEECAKLMDDMAKQDKHSNYYRVAAKAIRAKGNT